MKQEQLILPVYLNQRVVFDLVAMLQGGIATVTKVSEQRSSSGAGTGEISGAFGLSNALASLLKVDLSSRISAEGAAAAATTKAEERVHTPASLFHQLRNLMVEKRLLVHDGDDVHLASGDFLEFRATLHRNPFIEALDSILEMIDMFSAFSEKPKRQKGQKAPAQDLPLLQRQLRTLSGSLKSGDTLDLTTGELRNGARAVVTLESRFLNDPLMSDLIDGTFIVMGKVTRFVKVGEGSISLLRKSAIAHMPKQTISQLLKTFGDLGEEHQFAFSRMEPDVPGPVVQVLPVAIFA